MKTKFFTLLVAFFAIASGAKADGIYASTVDIGKVLCSDGSLYATVSDATTAGKTPVAMLAYIDTSKSKGLAISLEDATEGVVNKCPPAITIAEAYNTSHTLDGGTWRLPTASDWEYMFIGCGSTSEYVSPIPNSAPEYEIDGYPFSYGNIRSLMIAAGGADFYDKYGDYGYWTSTTPTTVGGDFRWTYFFSLAEVDNRYIGGFDMDVKGRVRPCVEFTVYNTENAHTLTIREGTEDADLWTITPNLIQAGKTAVLNYSGDKVVKSVMLAKSGKTGYSPHGSYLRRYDWWVTMPEYDDEVVIEYDDSYLIISENVDNRETLFALEGTKTDVIVSKKVTGWTLLTLPFDLPGGFDPRLGLSVKQFVGSSYDAEAHAVKLFFDDVTALKAGWPYLVKHSSTQARDLFNYPFTGVTIHNGVMPLSSIYGVLCPTVAPASYAYPPNTVLLFEEGLVTTMKEPPYVLFNPPHPYYWDSSSEISGLSGYFKLAGNVKHVFTEDMTFEVVFGPYVPEKPEPAKEEIVEKPGDSAKPGEVTTSDSGITTSLGEDDTVDPEEGSITMHTQLSTADVVTLLDIYEPGSSAFFETFKGFYFMLAAGKGKVEIELETLGDVALSIIKGSLPEGVFTMGTKGKITIEYNVEQDTWFFAFPVVEKSAEVKAYGKRVLAEDGALKIYSIKIVPVNETEDAIEEIRESNAGTGYIYNLQGQRVYNLNKGLYIIDGKKVVIK